MSQSVQDLIEALEDVDDVTREEAAKALADLGDPNTIDELLTAIEDDFWAVRVQIGWAFAKIGGERAIDGLIVLFNDSMMEVQAEAVLAMASIGVDTVPKLITCLKDERWRVREQAAKSSDYLKIRKLFRA